MGHGVGGGAHRRATPVVESQAGDGGGRVLSSGPHIRTGSYADPPHAAARLGTSSALARGGYPVAAGVGGPYPSSRTEHYRLLLRVPSRGALVVDSRRGPGAAWNHMDGSA